MGPDMNTKRIRRWAAGLVGLAALWAAAPAGAKPTSADVAATAPAAVHPGGTATVTVAVTVHDGLHAQSHEPGNPDYIPLVVTLSPAAGATVGTPKYPAGEDVNYPQLGMLNVYVGRVTVDVPVTVAADAPAGALHLSGKVSLQACNERACFQPESIPFAVDLTVAAAGPATAPATQPAVAPPPPPAKPSAALGGGGGGTGDWFARHLKTGGLPFALAGAFVVGILFNAVPCVLPVIPLKVMGFYEVSRHDRGRCLTLGAVFGAGIVAVFAVLGLLIVVLHWIDWGRLFQQTWFIAAITAVLVAMAAGTFGVFDFALPAGVYAYSPRHDNVSGNFLFGMLTAVLSTPCTFGLLTALLTFALTLPAVGGLAVFVLLGVGMAAPYVVLSAFPELARRFPRTGPWSEVVKQEMGLLMLAAAAFFAQPLLARVMSFDATWWVLFAAVALAAGFLTVRAAQLSGVRWPTGVAAALSLAMVAVALWGVLRLTRWPYEWQPYTPQRLADATAAGHPVVIDFTATWCSTCHVIEASALHDRRVVSAVRMDRAVMLKADVTRPDAIGQPLLEQLNPIGTIPLTAVYAPHAAADSRPAILDGIYSADDLVRTLSGATAQ